MSRDRISNRPIKPYCRKHKVFFFGWRQAYTHKVAHLGTCTLVSKFTDR